MAVVILRVYKYEKKYLENLSREGYIRRME